MTKPAIPHYHSRTWGEIDFYAAIRGQVEVHLEACENFQKRTSRNRYAVLGPNGVQHLTIPLVKGKNNGLPIKEVKISYDEDWITLHLRSLKAAYGKSAFFDHYYDQIEALYARRYAFLFDLNWESHLLANRWLKWNIRIVETAEWRGPEKTPDCGSLKYPQVFEYKFGYTPNLCILDLLFCMGPEAANFLPICD